MPSFFAIFQTALASFPHAFAMLISCGIFAASCGATTTPPLTALIPLPAISHMARTTSISVVTPQKSTSPISPTPAHSTRVQDVASTPTQNSSSYTSLTSANSSSGETTIQTSINGVTSTHTIPTGAGTQSIFISNTVNGETSVYASTTPISDATTQQAARDIESRAATLGSHIKAMMHE